MKKFLSLMAYAMLVSTVLMTSCKKDDKKDDTKKEEPVTETPKTVSPSYDYKNSAGALVGTNAIAQQTTPFVGVIDVEVFGATAAFPTTTGTLVDAGAITFKGKSLTKYENNAYVLSTPMTTDDESAKTWVVAGKGDIKAFTYTNTKVYPKVSSFSTIAKTIKKGQAFTVNYGTSTGSPDSIFVVVSSGASLQKTVAGNVSSVTFTAAETATLTASANALIQVTPYNLAKATFDSKDYYFINQSSYNTLNAIVE